MVSTRLLALALVLFGLVAAGAGCTPYKYTDDDETCTSAKPLPPGVAIKDELNHKAGDRSDCKEVKYFKDAMATVEFRLGTAFEKHDLKGVITLYDDEARVLDQRPVDPTIPKYDLEFKLKAQKPYYLKFEITEGSYGYSAQVQFKAVDPCASCDDDEECVEGKCKRKVKECDPECDEEAGELCDDGECKYQCDDSCQKKRGYVCEAATGECIKVLKECKPSCKTGYVCNRRTGQCVASAPKCKCQPGEICQGGKCVKLGGGPQPCPAGQRRDASGACVVVVGEPAIDPTGPITGSISNTARAPDGTVLYINRGERHGVKVGKRGTMCGQSFVVSNVYATRSKAKTAATIEQIGACTTFSLPR